MAKWKDINDFGLTEKEKIAMREDGIAKVKILESQLSNNSIAEIKHNRSVRFLNGAENDDDFRKIQVIGFIIGYFDIIEKDLGLKLRS